ncbi:MAG: glycogen/starch synthase [Candidatus Cloacimonadota bacterium]|nr:glycogen/starch synthase [Candidatus Cloacimonadota bacterium]
MENNTNLEYGREISEEFRAITPKRKKPIILIITPEITELPEGMGNAANLITAKGGGLGDISAGLVSYVEKSGKYEIHIVLPKYDKKIKRVSKLTNTEIEKLIVILSRKGIHLVNDSAFSYIQNPYDEDSVHRPVAKSFALQRFVINNLLDFLQPDVVHCNDWMTALIPAAAKAKGIKSLFTLHNIFTEKQTLYSIEKSGIRPLDFVEDLYFEKFPVNLKDNWRKYYRTNKVDFTSSGILASDYFNTVSKTFLQELVNDYFPDLVPRPIYQVIKQKYNEGKAVGIQNAPNERIDSLLMDGIINFSSKNLSEKKAENKIIFQQEMKLPIKPNTPLFFWPNRLYDQKGPDILVNNLEYFLNKYNFQLAVVADGDAKIEKQLIKLAAKFSNVAYHHFVDELSNLGKVGSDFILMPSRYEPCGIPQMEALRFATLPVVRATGGLKDTVQQLNIKDNTGNGFLFEMADKYGLEYGMKKAIDFYKISSDEKIRILKRIMHEGYERFNLKNTAQEYINIYDKLIGEK